MKKINKIKSDINNMDKISDRIKMLRKALGMTQTEFGSYLSMSQNHLTRLESGERELTDKNIKLISTISWPEGKKVNKEWLKSGTGSMFIKKNDDEEFAEAFNQINYHGDELIKKIIIDYIHLNDDNKEKAKKYILDLAAAIKKEKD